MIALNGKFLTEDAQQILEKTLKNGIECISIPVHNKSFDLAQDIVEAVEEATEVYDVGFRENNYARDTALTLLVDLMPESKKSVFCGAWHKTVFVDWGSEAENIDKKQILLCELSSMLESLKTELQEAAKKGEYYIRDTVYIIIRPDTLYRYNIATSKWEIE